MIKDMVVNLPLGKPRHVATEFAISVANTIHAHLMGIAFRYEPIIPVMNAYAMFPPELIESQRAENDKAAKVAVAKFEEAVRLAAISGESLIFDASVDAAPGMLASIARRFDLSVIAQPEPNEPTLGSLFIEAALFESGRPILVVPYIQTAGLKLDRVMVCWDGSSQCSSRCWRCYAVSRSG